MKEIAIYVEGGGDSVQQKAELRRGFDALFKAEKQAARAKGLDWRLVPGGGRGQAYDKFVNKIRNSTEESLVILLVDSEQQIDAETGVESTDSTARVSHLRQRDGWKFDGVEPTQIHLMVQCMETWIASDSDALAKFYGNGFRANQLPSCKNLEEEPKASVYDKLKRATRDTKKGEYAKNQARQQAARGNRTVEGGRALSAFQDFHGMA